MKLISNKFPDCYLKKISLEDVNQQYVSWLNDPSINQYLETRFQKQNITTIKSFIQKMQNTPNEYLFTIRTMNEGHIGNIKVGDINEIHKTAYISLFIGNKLAWGKGYGYQAIQLISQYAFTHLLIRKICASSYKPNIASIKTFLKAGFIEDGVLSNHYKLNNTPCDLVQLCMFKEKSKNLPKLKVI